MEALCDREPPVSLAGYLGASRTIILRERDNQQLKSEGLKLTYLWIAEQVKEAKKKS